jgi:predicted extracellular nuclease
MDAQQQVVALLESELQKSILGDSSTTVGDLIGVAGKVETIYDDSGVSTPDQSNFNAGVEWLASINEANSGFADTSEVDQDFLRQMLYQARALLGELRIEEQAWNGEVNSEKTLRKDVNDFAKV